MGMEVKHTFDHISSVSPRKMRISVSCKYFIPLVFLLHCDAIALGIRYYSHRILLPILCGAETDDAYLFAEPVMRWKIRIQMNVIQLMRKACEHARDRYRSGRHICLFNNWIFSANETSRNRKHDLISVNGIRLLVAFSLPLLRLSSNSISHFSESDDWILIPRNGGER